MRFPGNHSAGNGVAAVKIPSLMFRRRQARKLRRIAQMLVVLARGSI
jgi:hypothetical protein